MGVSYKKLWKLLIDKDMKKKAEITEDELKEYEKEMQELTDKRCKEIDELTAKKQAELMAV